jgi:hypothetical protein
MKMLKQIPYCWLCSDAVGRSRPDGVAFVVICCYIKGRGRPLTWLKRSERLHLLINHGLDWENDADETSL